MQRDQDLQDSAEIYQIHLSLYHAQKPLGHGEKRPLDRNECV